MSFLIHMNEVHELSIHNVIRKAPKKFPWNILKYFSLNYVHNNV